VIDTQAIDNWSAEAAENLGEAMEDALDLLTRDILVAGTNRCVDLSAYRRIRHALAA
jgi:hypothetical protein